jgi:glycosyltransferase involved in cell wall biosynthesis
MERSPRISLVTPSFNQARHVVDSIDSVLAVVPHVEHIVIDGGSTDGTVETLGRYPHLKLVVESGCSRAAPSTVGCSSRRVSSWEYWAHDALAPGALHRVAHEIDPSTDRHVILGRCGLVDDDGGSTGIEHPSRFENHRRVLEIWKGHMIPRLPCSDRQRLEKLHR